MKPALTGAAIAALLLLAAPVVAHGDDDHGAPLPPPAAPAQGRLFTATLNGANERPNSVISEGIGSGFASLAKDRNSLSVSVVFGGLTSGTRAAHIHCCVDANTAGPVTVNFPTIGEGAFPFDVVTGNFSRIFDLTLASTYGGGFLAANGGDPLRARATFVSGFESGLSYFNIHTANNPGGEIRGQITAVPEPASWALMIAGFGLVGLAMRSRSMAVAA